MTINSYKISTYRTKFSRDLLLVDRSFNRRVVWDSPERNQYFSSLLSGRVPSPHVMAHIEDCMAHSKALGDKVSEEYYKEYYDKGYKFISLDGQNRGESIVRLLNNEVPISGIFKDADGIEVEVENRFFSQLPTRLQDSFKDSTVSVVIYSDVLKSELTTIFRNIQAGCPLNEQEKRNSTLSPIAEWVREQRGQHQNAVKRITDRKKIIRMLDDENVAKIAMSLTRTKDWGLSAQAIDQWYNLGKDFNTLEDPNCPYGATEVSRIEEIIEMFAGVVNNQKVYSASQKIANNKWWAILYACEWACDNNYVIHSYKDFFNKLKHIDDKLSAQSELDYSQRRVHAISLGEDPDNIKKADFYFKWSTLPHQVLPRKKRKLALFAEIAKSTGPLTLRKRSQQAAA